MQPGKSITRKIVFTTWLGVIVLAVCLVSTMTFFMYSLTDTILLNILQPTAKMAAKSVEGNLHTLADRFALIRTSSALTGTKATAETKKAALERVIVGIEFEWLGIYGANGALIVGNEQCPRTIVGRDLFKLMKETDNLAIEETSVGSSGLEIVMGAPMQSSQLGSTNYLAGSYKYDILSDVLSDINIGESGTAFIINANGTVIAHKDLGQVYSRASIVGSMGDSEKAQALIRTMKQGQTGSMKIVSPEDGPSFVSYAPVRGTSWSLGIKVPRSNFISPVQQAVAISIFITALLLLFFAISSKAFITKILTQPLLIITDSASKLAEGKFGSTLPAKLADRNDEIGQLSSAFIKMSDSIMDVIKQIGQLTNAARTGALNERVDASTQQGDYQLILAGMNATLDVVCSHLDSMPGAFALFGENREPLYLNREMQEIFITHELHEKDASLLAAIVSPEVEGTLDLEVDKLFGQESKNGDTYKKNVVLFDQKGDERDYALILRRIGDNESQGLEDKNICVMLIASDITVLTNAKVAAEMASKAKSNFLSNMSHEMRTPMNAIIGMTTIAKATDSNERKDYCLGKIDAASTHLLGVINDILDMSKIEANKFELSPSTFDFEKMLQKVINVVNFKVDEKQQKFIVHVDEKIPHLLIGDDQRLTQVITNLLSNAIKFTPEGGKVSLTAKMLEENDGLCTIQVIVTDNGIGISAEQQERLFSSFVQADSGTSRKYGGTGLGLAISKHIIEMMGGQICIESELGAGATFIFTIQAMRATNEKRGLLKLDRDWSSVSILAVDDEPEIRDYFRAIAKRLGLKCEVAASGEEACALIEQTGGYDVYFVDWRMPGLDGIELSRRIKEGHGAHSVVIMISATEWSFIEDDAKSAGVDKFLSKPLFISDVADIINQCLGSEILPDTEVAIDTAKDAFVNHRIILAEDVEVNREIVLAILASTGLKIDIAETGLEALRLFEDNPQAYDMIFMDIHMPEMDGYEATREIRKLNMSKAKNIPIIAMTANVFREDIEKCFEAGMNDHVGKPLNFEEVLSKLYKFLPKKRSR